MEINLKSYRPSNSTSYSGRPQGESVREKLKLSQIDKEDGELSLVIPSDTTSFNPSFFLGLLYDSIKNLGMEKFKKKYHLLIETNNEALKQAIKKNIEDGLRNADNSLNGRNAFNLFQ
nr:hypothetical protein [Mucilaginibacter sp. SP1R1]MBB6152770.1 hypothetical protein [Mucilaginibacter sp. SP1R1]